jgi:hypothetical protein
MAEEIPDGISLNIEAARPAKSGRAALDQVLLVKEISKGNFNLHCSFCIVHC